MEAQKKENEILAESFKMLLKDGDEAVLGTIKEIVGRNQLEALHSLEGAIITQDTLAVLTDAIDFVIAHKAARLRLPEILKIIFINIRNSFPFILGDVGLFSQYCHMIRSLLGQYEEEAMIQFIEILRLMLLQIQDSSLKEASLEVWMTVVKNCSGGEVARHFMHDLNIFNSPHHRRPPVGTLTTFLALWQGIVSSAALNAEQREGVINVLAVLLRGSYPELERRAFEVLRKMFENSKHHEQEPATTTEWRRLVVPLIVNAELKTMAANMNF